MKVFPTDIQSFARLGTERAAEIRWPVSDEEFFRLMLGYREAFEEILPGLEPAQRGVLRADFSFVGFLAQVSHAAAVLGRVREMGGRVEVGPLAQPIYEPDWQTLGRIEPQDSGGSRLNLRVRGLAKDLKFNDTRNVLKRIMGGGRVSLGLGSFSRLKGEYARERGIYVRNAYMGNLLPPRWRDGEPPAKITRAAEDMIRRVNQVFKGLFGFDLDFIEDAAACWKRRLGILYAVHETLKTRRDLPEEVMITEVAKPLHKTVAEAFRSSGRRAVGFHHGNSMGGRPLAMRCYTELSSYDVFVCPTRACAEAYADDYKACTLSRHSPVEIISTETSYYNRLHLAMAGKKLPKRIRNVMLMGFPMNAHRYDNLPCHFFLFQLDLEMRLARFLRRKGYRVLYKIHPERQDGVRAFMEPVCDEILPDPFEACWERADALLVKYTATSTFGFALCTNRPILLLDHERGIWRKRHYALLERRCRIIPAWMDHEKVIFDEDAMLEALADKPGLPDDTYVRELMYPDAVLDRSFG